MFQHIDAAQLLAFPKAAPSRFGEGNNSSEIGSALATLDDDVLGHDDWHVSLSLSRGHPSIARRPPPRFRKREGGWRFCV